ncbi:MAG TPA: TolC family protein [Rubricoccaceae bacterium]|jgi:outer membrane protein
MTTTPTTARCTTALALALLLAASSVRAQEVRTITLDEAIALARMQAVTVRQAATGVAEREAAVAEARGRFYPALSVYTAGAQNYGLSFDETAGQLTQQRTEAVQIGAQAEWSVYDGGARRAGLATARADLSASEYGRERTAQTAVNDVFRQFYEVVAAQAEARIAQANVEAHRQQLALVDATIAAGVRPRVERLQQDERLAEAELVVLQAERAERAAGLRLIRLLALDPAGRYQFVPPPGPSPADPAGVDAESLVAAALERRLDLRAQEATVAAAEADVQAARAAGRPSVGLVFGYGTSFTTGAEGAFTSQFGSNRGGALGIRVGFPVFDRGVTRSRVGAASARLERARLDAEDARRGAATDVREAVLELDLLVGEVRVAERRLAAARTSLDAETERYRLGATTLAALAEVRARTVAAEVGLERSRAAVAFQRALIDYRSGAASPGG